MAFSPGGRHLFDGSRTWTLPAWTGSLAALDAFLVCHVPWKLIDSTLFPHTPDPKCRP